MNPIPLLTSQVAKSGNGVLVVPQPVRKKTNLSVDCSKIKALINIFESFKERQHYSITNICYMYGVTRRIFYDFITIMAAVEIVKKINSENFIWISVKKHIGFIEQIKDEMKKENVKIEMFNCENNGQLSEVTIKLIKLFYFLGTDTVDIRKVSKLFVRGIVKRKTMIRKLYTITTSLEIIDLISKMNEPGIFKISIKPVFITDLELLLNHNTSTVSNEDVYFKRRKLFNDLTND